MTDVDAALAHVEQMRTSDLYRRTADERTMIALAAEVKRLHSWDGLMSLLNEHWPDDIFVTAPDPEDYHEPLYRRSSSTGGETYSYVRANPGAIITGLIRWVDKLREDRCDFDCDTCADKEPEGWRR